MLRFRPAVYVTLSRPLTPYFGCGVRSLRESTRYTYATVHAVENDIQKGAAPGGEAFPAHPHQSTQRTECVPYTLDDDIRRALRHVLLMQNMSDDDVHLHLAMLISRIHAAFSASNLETPVELQIKHTIVKILSREPNALKSLASILRLVRTGNTAGILPELLPDLKDVEWYKKTLPLPKPDDYPNAPLDWMDPSALENCISHVVRRNKLTMKLSTSYAEKEELSMPRKKVGLSPLHGCTIIVEIGDSFSESIFGEGVNQKEAKRAALLFLASKLHTSDILRQLFSGPPKGQHVGENDVDPRSSEITTNPLTAIYDYAASFGIIPIVVAKVIKKRYAEMDLQDRGQSASIVSVTITVPEHGIDVVASDEHWKTAESSAIQLFRLKVEETMSNRETNLSYPNSRNARDFINFYLGSRSGHYFKIEYRTLEIGEHCQGARIIIDGKQVGEQVWMNTKEHASQYAQLTAALAIAKDHPDIFRAYRGTNDVPGGRKLLPPVTVQSAGTVTTSRLPTRGSQVTSLKRKRKRIVIRLPTSTTSGAFPCPSPPLAPVDLPISIASLRFMQDGVIKARQAGLPNQSTALEAEEQIVKDQRWSRKPLSPNAQATLNRELLKEQHKFEKNKQTAALRQLKAFLPIRAYSQQLLDMISKNQYCIVVGATGSGKTTQVPQIILEQAIAIGEGASCNIICTQPRRIAALSVGQRVAMERNEELGRSVGYSVRFDSKRPRLGGSITYCTTGFLLEQLKFMADPIFDTTSHIIIDEVHERNRDTDFLLVVLKRALAARRAVGKNNPKVVIMSATINTQLFQEYFAEQVAGGRAGQCSIIDVPGRTFPVVETYLDDIVSQLREKYNAEFQKLLDDDPDGNKYLSSEENFVKAAQELGLTPDNPVSIDAERLKQWNASDEQNTAVLEREEGLIAPSLVAATIADICHSTRDGALLAFLPGIGEITDVENILRDPAGVFGIDFNDTKRFKIHILHSMVPKEQQSEVFLTLPPGTRRIILSTNIAETSITVPDVKYVVDSGKQRELRYDQLLLITRLQTCWSSKSNIKQRAGRAGRVQKGFYYGLFSRERQQSMRAVGLAEILRTDLRDTCLSIKAHGFKEDVGDFLSAAIEPPDPEAIQAAVRNLKAVEAFTEDESITALGRVLSKLRLLPSLGKMVLLGIIFRCLDSMIILGACMQERDLLLNPITSRGAAKAAHKKYVTEESDQLAALKAFKELRQIKLEQGYSAAKQHAGKNFLHFETFQKVESVAESIVEVLVETGLVPPSIQSGKRLHQLGDPALNRNSNNKNLISALILAGFNSNIAVKAAGKNLLYHTPIAKLAQIQPSSLNGGAYLPEGTMFLYRSMRRGIKGAKLFLEGTTPVDPVTTVLFGGSLQLGNDSRVVKDGWLPLVVKEPGGPDSWHYVRNDRIVTSAMLLVEFRDCLDRMLNDAFRSLSFLQRAVSAGEEEEDEDEKKGGLQYLADDPARDLFAQRVVELLERTSDSTETRTEVSEPEWPSADVLLEYEQGFDDDVDIA